MHAEVVTVPNALAEMCIRSNQDSEAENYYNQALLYSYQVRNCYDLRPFELLGVLGEFYQARKTGGGRGRGSLSAGTVQVGRQWKLEK